MIFLLEKKKFFPMILFLLVAVEIFFISSIPGSRTGSGIPLTAIVYHFCVFFLFSFFLFFTIIGNKKPDKYLIFVVFLSSLAYAVIDEIHQSFVPLRSSSVEDVLVDFIGITLSLVIAVFISKKSSQEY
ncbi:MAG: VanZ family protein [Nanoarchaeota archaeon]